MKISPEPVKRLAKGALIDYVGVTYIGANTGEAEIIKRYVMGKQNDECKAIGLEGYFCIEDAAIMNGFFPHVLDYDDAGIVGHPTQWNRKNCHRGP